VRDDRDGRLTPHVGRHEVFLGLTRDSGWSVADFKHWLYAALTQQLLDPALRGSPNAATAGLTVDEHRQRPDEAP
jgi:hypothetical protein